MVIIDKITKHSYHNYGLMSARGFTCRSDCRIIWVIFDEESRVRDARQLAGQQAEPLGRGTDDRRQAGIGRHVGQLEDAIVEGGRRWGTRAEMGVLKRRERGGAIKPSQFNVLLHVVVLMFLLLLLLLLFFRHLVA